MSNLCHERSDIFGRASKKLMLLSGSINSDVYFFSSRFHQWRNRNIFQRGKVTFPDFFPGVKFAFLLVKIVHFGRPLTNFSGCEK